jgi:hypothetical protein
LFPSIWFWEDFEVYVLPVEMFIPMYETMIYLLGSLNSDQIERSIPIASCSHIWVFVGRLYRNRLHICNLKQHSYRPATQCCMHWFPSNTPISETELLLPELFMCTQRETSSSQNVEGTKSQEHTTVGIRWSSPTQLLIHRSGAYVWQSGRDAQFSPVYGRMCSDYAYHVIYSISSKVILDLKLLL